MVNKDGDNKEKKTDAKQRRCSRTDVKQGDKGGNTKIPGIIIPVHGDGACWYRAMAKICNKVPMQFIKDMEKTVMAHKHRRN